MCANCTLKYIKGSTLCKILFLNHNMSLKLKITKENPLNLIPHRFLSNDSG